MRTFSPYTRIYEFDDDHMMIFDTVNKSIIKVNSDWIGPENSIDEAAAGEAAIETLAKYGFFRTADEGRKLAETEMSDRGRLSISVELSLGCNLRCPYCYQGDEKRKKTIAPQTLNALKSYVATRVDSGELREVVIKVLGGEPSLVWRHIDTTLRDIASFCRNRVRFTLMVDTNGVFVEPFMALDYADRYLFTVPLTHKHCHDSMRFDSSGNGTFERVVDGVSKLMTLPNASVILRHNTDAENASVFSEYLDSLSGRFAGPPLIDISYTASFEGTGYKNKLAYHEYLRWRTDVAIPELLKRDYPVLVSPMMNVKPCQRMGFGSFKLFSDDTVGYCAMDFFAEKRMSFLGLDQDCFEGIRESIPSECTRCKSFFICGGSYHLPCIQSLGYDCCEADGAFNVDLESFLRLYLKSNKPQLFPVFNQSLNVR